MLFSAPDFFAFFLVYFCLHLIVPSRYRLWLIIAGSTFFYAWWRAAYVWIPYLLMAIAYGGVLWIETAEEPRARRRRLAATVVGLFAPLAFFKYIDFFYGDVLGPIFGWQGKIIDLPLPLGVSFVTFTLTAFVVDIYRGKFPVERRPQTVLAYVLFFPHLIAGPILRPHELIPQLARPRPASLRRLVVPLAIFSIGLVKKLVFADQIADFIDPIYAHPGLVSGADALLAIYGFTLQIYCDFSGYTNMAIGLALALGVRLPNNFLRPYGAGSLIEFWRRWHITLSFWLRDYLYIPLGGNRHGRRAEVRNLMITMVLGGLWHGANWTFVIWGTLHGVGLTVTHLCKRVLMWPRPGAIPRWLSVLVTFHIVTVAWVFFRARSLDRAVAMFESLFAGGWSGLYPFVTRNVFALTLIVVFLLLHRFDDHRRIKAACRYLRPEILWPAIGLLWLVAITVSQGSSAKFIYFDF